MEGDSIRIGDYQHCYFIASGVTSDVYRSTSLPDREESSDGLPQILVALKVIIPTHQNMEPHSPTREIRILQSLHHPSIIPLLSTFRDQEQRLVLAFPYMPRTLASLIPAEQGHSNEALIRPVMRNVLDGLRYLHAAGIIHRDVKPSAILLPASTTPAAVLSDFGTAWHPAFSPASEPPAAKILDVGTGPYRAPELLFGHAAYTEAIDIWSLGVTLTELLTSRPVFESRPAHEDGSQLGLILSIFKTLGTPTEETWPEAKGFKVTPFELWTAFPRRSWEEVLPTIGNAWRDLIREMLRFDGGRVTAEDVSRVTNFLIVFSQPPYF